MSVHTTEFHTAELHELLMKSERPKYQDRTLQTNFQVGSIIKDANLFLCFGTSSGYLSGLCLFPFPFTSISSSEESAGDAVFVFSRMCSCWARYWEGVCLAARAQCSSSLCNRGRLACKTKGSFHLNPETVETCCYFLANYL